MDSIPIESISSKAWGWVDIVYNWSVWALIWKGFGSYGNLAIGDDFDFLAIHIAVRAGIGSFTNEEVGGDSLGRYEAGVVSYEDEVVLSDRSKAETIDVDGSSTLEGSTKCWGGGVSKGGDGLDL